jgi:putative SOS response-associated peptidase YedK
MGLTRMVTVSHVQNCAADILFWGWVMCGRFNLTASPESVNQQFNLGAVPEFRANYNIAPGSHILVVRPEGKAEHMLWGLVPFFAKDKKFSYNCVNARLDSITNKPSFRAAFKQRHILVPCSGYFEWQQTELGKQAYHITLPDHGVFGFAGLWEHWQNDNEEINSCTIITTAANDKLHSVHTRMPVIVEPSDYDQWLDTDQSKDAMLVLLSNDSAYDSMVTIPVSNYVNNSRHNDPECIKPVSLP